MSKYTDIITKEQMCKHLSDCGIENPLRILTDAIESKASIYIPKLKGTLAWIYKGDKPWNFHGNNSNNLDDYNYQIMPQ